MPSEFSSGVGNGRGRFIYHAGLDALLRLNGSFTVEGGGTRQKNEIWAWNADGSVERLSSGSFDFDMTVRSNGLWQYDTIDIGPNTIVNFLRNDDNTPVRWLASGDVNIEGVLDLSGTLREDPDLQPLPKGLGGYPGPGAFKGATGGPVGINLRVFGDGPGGGLYTGAAQSNDASFDDYGNAWLYPLIGGSGAGNVNDNQGGGGGGGAIMIASSTEILLQGTILTEGGIQGNANSGRGSRGAVLLRANTLKALGTIYADRIRLEGWTRETDELEFFISRSQNKTEGPPLLPIETGVNAPRLWIESINGAMLQDPLPSNESQLAVDAEFTTNETVAIVVKGENIPESTEIILKISLEDGTVLTPESVLFTGGQAVFNLDLPDGYGAIQTIANFPVDI